MRCIDELLLCVQFSKVKFLTSSAQQVVDAIKDSSVCSLDPSSTMIKPNTVVRGRCLCGALCVSGWLS